MSYKNALLLIEKWAAYSLTTDSIFEVRLRADSQTAGLQPLECDTNELIPTEFNTHAHHWACSALTGSLHAA